MVEAGSNPAGPLAGRGTPAGLPPRCDRYGEMGTSTKAERLGQYPTARATGVRLPDAVSLAAIGLYSYAFIATRMERSELYELWTENSSRPVWVREHRDEIHDHTDLNEPIPSGGVAAVANWLDRYKGTVTRQLDDDADGTDPENSEVAA